MGSKIVTALVEQRGNIKTNPVGLVPDTSRPILQVGALKTDSVASAPLQQVLSAKTASDSKPVEQVPQRKFPNLTFGEVRPDDAIIEQKVAATEGGPLRPGPYQGPLEQFERISTNGRVEQREAKREATVNGTPIEQQQRPQNMVGVEQFNFVELIFPPCGSLKNPTNTNILWRIRDFGFPFDSSTLVFKVNGLEVQNRTGFVLTDLGTGLQIQFDPADDFAFDSEVELFVEISDTAPIPNTFFTNCRWRTVSDTQPPIITNVVPCEQDNVEVTSPVEFDVLDRGVGVELSSVVLAIEGINVCTGLTFEPKTIPGLGSGFHVKWVHPEDPFRFGANITVSISAADKASPPNSTLFVCDFNTVPSKAPVFQNFDPLPCETFVDSKTGLTFEVFGDIHGIDISTLEVRVDNKLRKVVVRPRVLRL